MVEFEHWMRFRFVICSVVQSEDQIHCDVNGYHHYQVHVDIGHFDSHNVSSWVAVAVYIYVIPVTIRWENNFDFNAFCRHHFGHNPDVFEFDLTTFG